MCIHTSLAEYKITDDSQGQIHIFLRSEKSKTSQFLPLFSQRDICRDINRRIGNFSASSGFLAIVHGLAQLPLILKLLENQNSIDINIVIFEADLAFAEKMIIKFKSLLTHVLIISRNNTEHINEYCDQVNIEEFLGYRIFEHQAVENVDAHFYKESDDIFKNNMASKISDLFTRMEFEPVWIKNSITNLLAINKSKPVKELFNRYSGNKVMLISTGPSLRQSLEYIKQNQNHIYIACVDSAYRVLHRYGITPDFIFSLDSQTFTSRHFSLLPLGDPHQEKAPALIADLVANPTVVHSWQGPCYYSTTAQFLNDRREITPGCDYIESLVMPNLLGNSSLEYHFGDIQSGGSVATSLFDLLRQMNFDKILLVGQDLAYTNREIHCSGTHHSDVWLSKNTNRLNSIENVNYSVVKKRHTQEVTSIKNKPIVADYILSLYATWFSNAASLVDSKLVNCTTDGLKIKNIRYSTLEIEMKDSKQSIQKKFYGNNFIIERKKLDDFYQQILQANLEDNNTFDFLNKIGRKYKIMYNRKNQRNSKNFPSNIKAKIKQVQEIFWHGLQKNLKRYAK